MAVQSATQIDNSFQQNNVSKNAALRSFTMNPQILARNAIRIVKSVMEDQGKTASLVWQESTSMLISTVSINAQQVTLW